VLNSSAKRPYTLTTKMKENISDLRVLILIPARFDSTRFPGKPLKLLKGKTIIQRVLENCWQLNKIEEGPQFETCVVTDDQRIEDHVKKINGQVVRVDDEVSSGTLRIQLAFERFFQNKKYDLILNVQGDEPLLLSEDIQKLATFHLSGPFGMATMLKKMKGTGGEFTNPNKVKCIFTEENSQCHYFSRASIPYKRGDDILEEDFFWYHHIGVYSFLPKVLQEIVEGPHGHYEKCESLEQLRCLNLGIKIGAVLTESNISGVDTPEDLKKLEGVISE
jgi:3-deoxy-manno-octulosonate cytidylyltransferase (CMP-KDO synthetase)